MSISRRSLFAGIGAAVVAPALPAVIWPAVPQLIEGYEAGEVWTISTPYKLNDIVLRDGDVFTCEAG